MSSLPSVLICGKIRDDGLFEQDLDVYQSWRDQGFVDRLVFSGWLEDHNHPILHRMRDSGIKIVLSFPPVIKGPGHIFHQMKTLHYGLREFAPDDLILRSRTDKTWLHFSMPEATKRFWSSPAPGPASPFQRRMIIQQALPLQPFFYNDIMFMGLATDIAKMVSYDAWYELEHAVLNPEQIFHYYPFRGQSPATEAFLHVNPGLEHYDLGMSVELYRLLLREPLYRRALAEGLTQLESSYRIGWSASDWSPDTQFRSLSDLLGMPTGNREVGLWMAPGANSLIASDEAAIRYLFDTPILDGDSRCLRDYVGAPISSAALTDEAEALADAICKSFPDRLNPPVYPHMKNGLKIIPPRVQSIVAA